MSTVLFILHPDQDAKTLKKVTSAIHRSCDEAGVAVTLSSWAERFGAILQPKHDKVFFLGADVIVSHSAVAKMLTVFAEDDTAAVVYADVNSLRLPDYSPQRLLCQNYLSQLVAISAQKIKETGGLDGDLTTAAATYDLVLKLSTSNERFVHVKEVLGHTASKKLPEISEEEIAESRKVLSSARHSLGGGVVGDYLGDRAFFSRGQVKGNPLVSIVIPTQAKSQNVGGVAESLVLNAVRSIVELTDYSNYEVVAVVDAEAEQAVLDELSAIAGSKLNVVRWNKPFNFSQKMNYGVLHARGEYVLLLNDDVKVLSESWLRSMLVLAQLPNAGMVGAMLYYEDDTIQHAGHAYYQGSPTHIGLELPRGSRGPDSSFLVEREVSGVTAACALMPLEVFKKVGGFTALLPGNFNDVDLCLKVGWCGYDIYWTPDAELYHYESKTRDAHVHYYELDVIEHRWGLRLDDSRYWALHPAAAI